MGILKRSVNLGDIVFQSGYGVPDHIALKSTIYIDLDSAIEYINKDGISLWKPFLDSTFSGASAGSIFTGGTVTGPTNFLDGLTSNTISTTSISATTYYGLPLDIYVTGGTYSSNVLYLTNTSGSTFQVSGFSSGGGGQTENFAWTFKSGVLGIDPGSGNFRLNNVDLSGTTELYIDSQTFNGIDIDTIFNSVSGNWNLYLQDADNSTKFGLFSTVGSGWTNNGGWWTIPVTNISYGTGGTLTNNSLCTFLLINKNGSSTIDTYITGGTYNSSGSTTFTNNQGGGFTVYGYTTPFTGGTVSGPTIFTGGLTANTISATSIISTSFIKSGGTNVQLLAADGSVVIAGTNVTITNGEIISLGGSGNTFTGGTITGPTTFTEGLTACTNVNTNNLVSCSGNSIINLSTDEIDVNTSILPKIDNTIDVGTPFKRFRNINTVSGNSTVWTSTIKIITPEIDLGIDSESNSRIITANNSIIQDDILNGDIY